jgi:hypothetical protein
MKAKEALLYISFPFSKDFFIGIFAKVNCSYESIHLQGSCVQFIHQHFSNLDHTK